MSRNVLFAALAVVLSAVAAIALLLVPGFVRTDTVAAGCGTTGGRSSGGGAAVIDAQTRAPIGVPGKWTPTFSDDFDAAHLNRAVWSTTWFGARRMNGAAVLPSNVRVSGSCLVLSIDGSGKGAVVTSNPRNGDVKRGFQVGTGVVVEARVRIPGNGSRIHAWPAWWVNGQVWPLDGETDIVEGLSGRATTNYHSSGGHTVSDPIPGSWGGDWHTYALERERGRNRIYWDGRLVASYRTDDPGAPQYLLFTLRHSIPPDGTRTAELQVDYVRVWRAAR